MAGILVIVVGAMIAAVGSRLHRGQRPGERPSERHYRAGLALAQAGNGPQAVGEWKLAIAMDPTDARPYQALATYFEAAGQPDAAVEMLQRLSLANPMAPHRDCRLAQAAFAAGWFTEAQEAAERAVRAEPGCPLAHTMRGIVLADAGETDDGLAELRKAHALSPEDERITLTLAQIEGRSGQREAALRQVQEVLRQDPSLPQAHYLMGWLLARSGPRSASEAIRHLRQALSENPQSSDALAELGALYVRQGEFARARPLLEAARRQDPTDPELSRNLALTAARLGDPHAQELLATAHRLQEQQQQRRSLRHLHYLHPADLDITVHLARLELAAGQVHEAGDLASQVLRANPDHRGALDLMQQIRTSGAGPG